jgi:hypothetical protein
MRDAWFVHTHTQTDSQTHTQTHLQLASMRDAWTNDDDGDTPKPYSTHDKHQNHSKPTTLPGNTPDSDSDTHTKRTPVVDSRRSPAVHFQNSSSKLQVEDVVQQEAGSSGRNNDVTRLRTSPDSKVSVTKVSVVPTGDGYSHMKQNATSESTLEDYDCDATASLDQIETMSSPMRSVATHRDAAARVRHEITSPSSPQRSVATDRGAAQPLQHEISSPSSPMTSLGTDRGVAARVRHQLTSPSSPQRSVATERGALAAEGRTSMRVRLRDPVPVAATRDLGGVEHEDGGLQDFEDWHEDS